MAERDPRVEVTESVQVTESVADSSVPAEESENGAVAQAEAAVQHDIAQIARVLHAARGAAVPVFHCTMARRPDGGGAVVNCLLLAATRKSGGPGLPIRLHFARRPAPEV